MGRGQINFATAEFAIFAVCLSGLAALLIFVLNGDIGDMALLAPPGDPFT